MTRSSLESRAQRRRLIVILLLGVTFLSFSVLALSSWLFLRRMGRYLEEDRRRQLTAAASLGARLLESRFYPISASLKDQVNRTLLRGALLRMQVEAQLQAAYLIDEERRVILASQPELFEGEVLSYLVQDTAAIRRAFLGIPSASQLHRIGDSRFLNAYAPVGLSGEKAEFVFVSEAAADFFQILDSFRRGLILGGLTGVGIFVLFALALVWGVRKLVETEDALRRQERLAAMGQVAASVAHEIRNPLGIIRNTAQVLRRRYGGEEHDPLFDFIPEEVERLNRLVTNYLTLAREPQLDPRSVELGEFLQRLVAMDEGGGKAVRLEVPAGVRVLCDPSALERILLNLLRNAREASGDAGEVAVGVRDVRRRGRGYVGISVRDTGPGLPEDVPTDRLFEPFYTTKKTGTGLGLAVSKALAEASGGWIEARNHPDGGAEITVYLPAA